MINLKSIGSLPHGSEYIYIYEHFEKIKNSLVYIAKNDLEIFNIKDKLEWFIDSSNILIFRSWDQIPYDKVSPSKEIQSERIKTIYEILNSNNKYIILTSVNSILQKTIDESFIKQNVIELTLNKNIEFDNLIDRLIFLGFNRTSIVRNKSEFAIRGNIIDLFLIDKNNPLRLDFFDNKIETIKEFDILTQKTIKTNNFDNIIINSSTEVVLNKKTIKNFRQNFRQNFNDYRSSEYYHSVSEGMICQGIEKFLPFFYDKMSNFFKFCKKFDFILCNNFFELLDTRLENIHDYYNARLLSSDAHNIHYDKLYLDKKTVLNSLSIYKTFHLNNFLVKNGENLILKIQPKISTIKKEIDFKFIKKYFEINKKEHTIIICVQSYGALDRVKKILIHNINLDIIEINSYKDIKKLNHIYISVLKLNDSILYKNKIFLNEKTIFGFNFVTHNKRFKPKEVFFDEINKFIPGNILVHIEYGFCKFIGIKKLLINQSYHDCLDLEFADNEKLFLPVENLNFISKYSNESKNIQLDKLSSYSWQKRKANTKKRIEKIANELIKTSAERLLSKSPSIYKYPQNYDKFVSTFPFAETEDQINAIEDIKSDFNESFPSDRLIVGDVAYGKSEVVIRAIYMVAMSSLQSLVLVPTTLLARQHYINFFDRFKSFGIKINQLSRLISFKEKKLIINDLKLGKIDCIIGTHALLSENIEFKNLGLIVIDEEQHFGVKAKEKLKKLSANAHIITLSATPIPRTLQLSLSGVKKLSLILTPPYERLSIRTYISIFDKITIKEAIKREVIGRKGGVFWVTPRTKDIPFLEKFLKDELPEIKYVIAHGKLSSKILNERISNFYEGKIPLLISTNIIESGLDLPNVNTIIIHKANMFGLSQLHQLRGRVGRSSNRRGYAYLTYQQETDLKDNSTKRLNIINTYDKIGSGFNIASSDLELRGSGNIIGTDQSGFIKEVGIELYNQLLEDEINKQKNINKKANNREAIKFQPIINLPETIFIPDHYINDIDIKISIYKRISLITEYKHKENIMTELIDRFGKLPVEVENLFKLIEIKILCYHRNIKEINFGQNGILITFYKNQPLNPEKIININKNNNNKNFKIRPDSKVFYDFNNKPYENAFKLINYVINLIS